jgi:hypothetical protein
MFLVAMIRAFMDGQSADTDWMRSLVTLLRIGCCMICAGRRQPEWPNWAHNRTSSRVINHVSGHKGGVAGIYNRAAYEKEKRESLNLWAEHVMALVEGHKAVVVPMKRA